MNIIKEDYSYIKGFETKLIDAGYGKLTVHSLHFGRYISEEQKEINRKFFENMTDSERNNYFNSAEFEEKQRAFGKSLKNVLDIFIGKYDIHQISEETSTVAHYGSDWDLHFWSDRGWSGKDYMSCFTLSFNDARTPEQNMKLLNEIIYMLKSTENEAVCCRVQYDAYIDEKAVAEAAKKGFEGIAGKFVSWCGYDGKIKIVNNEGNDLEYGFFKKGAKSKYYKISNADLVAMNL